MERQFSFRAEYLSPAWCYDSHPAIQSFSIFSALFRQECLSPKYFSGHNENIYWKVLSAKCFPDIFKENDSGSQRLPDWLPLTVMTMSLVVISHQLSCCINVVIQTSSWGIWLESQSTSVELTCENSQLCRCLWLLLLLSPAPTVTKRIEFQRYRSPHTYSPPWNAPRIQFVDSYPDWSGAKGAGFNTSDPVVYVIWKQLKPRAGILPWQMLMAERRPLCLKEPLLVSLQNSGAYGFSKYAVHSFRFSSNK